MLAAAERIPASAPILFVPRQIMLGAHSAAADKKKAAPPVSPALEEKKEKRRKKKRSETLEADSIAPLETLDSDLPNGGTLVCKENGRGILFSSIAAFLESNGFSKTLAAFRSEAQHEINGGKTSVLNLEDEFCKFLKTSRTYAETSIDRKNELGSEKGVMHGNGHSDNVLDATEHHHSKNRKSTGVDDVTKVESLETHTTELEECSKECISADERVVNIPVDGLQVKSKGKKSKKLYSEDDSAQNTMILGDKNMKEMKTSGGRIDLEMVHTEESKVETKDKKKKKKLVSEPRGELLESCHLEGNHVDENIDCGNQLPKPNASNKEKRKKKEKESKNSGKSPEVVEEKSESNPEHRSEKINKKKRTSESVSENAEHEMEASHEINDKKSNNLKSESNPEHRSEKTNKKKRTSESVSENAEHEMEASQEINDKKSNNLKSVGCESNTDFKLSESVAKDASIKNAVDNADSKSKDKKKNRGKLISSNLCALGSDQLNEGSSKDAKEGHTGHGNSDSGKEKALVSEEIVEISEKNSKKRKKLSLQENTLRAKNDATKNFDDTEYEGAEDNNVGKKRKMGKSDENSTKTVETSPNEKLNMLIDCKETPSTCDSKEAEQHQLVNGNTEKKKKEQDTASKVSKNEKRSAEPKTVNAFQRVKIDEVKFIDERLQDNSYWAKGGADSGYGAKAQEILGQVRGRDFRHEKTKKKRGSYRGGQIDLESHSIKFSYSDEE